MSNCGNCSGGVCTCSMNSSGTVNVFGSGGVSNPYQARPSSLQYRPIGMANRDLVQSITLNTDTVIIFEKSQLNISNNMWNISHPTSLVAPINGLYLVSGFVAQDSVSNSGLLTVWIAKNGVANYQVRRSVNTELGTAPLYCSVSTLIRMNAGDYIELYVRSIRTASTPLIIAVALASPHLDAVYMGA